ncbi:hypothetical protein RRU94_00925 [Domibacillus sp. DTU_2020_1001157_1_SI_ALB_TIR_016]|uniref:hypothetical protein n=1 Tax=Domibacillus sp. DTU_2020_1001157_1_SI_ALB_TIR_016 TaxID=3077789 RepID=UPI0028EE8E75|nr:hypothetical protein [Domibacillus sp. DTU_2020_1001157_1_SI_ALB_TIR_016]WNS78571.1 hypothetical protein RRU94_00925 [Domibacillus sp. DTU_2020_1001157_1_SI_ALB_TIR_016]
MKNMGRDYGNEFLNNLRVMDARPDYEPIRLVEHVYQAQGPDNFLKSCDYCNKEKNVVFYKPDVMDINGKCIISLKSRKAWTCLECYSKDLAALKKQYG